jgi:hypothetical protein
LNRHVWTLTDHVPSIGHVAVRHLQAPLTAVQQTGENELLLLLGDEQFGARVLLVREHSTYAVDDVMLIAGPDASLQARLKRRLREELVHGNSVPRRMLPANTAMAYGAAASRGLPDGGQVQYPHARQPINRVVHAGYDEPASGSPLEPSASAFESPGELVTPAEFTPRVDMRYRSVEQPGLHAGYPADSGERVHIVPGAYATGR